MMHVIQLQSSVKMEFKLDKLSQSVARNPNYSRLVKPVSSCLSTTATFLFKMQCSHLASFRFVFLLHRLSFCHPYII